MGQKQHSSKYHYSEREYKEEKEDNSKKENDYTKYNNIDNSNENNKDKKSDDESNEEDDNSSEDDYYSYENLVKKLKHMNLSEQDIEDNYDFYKANYVKLIKVNTIINDIKLANLYNLTPFEMLTKLVPESELKNIPPEYNSSDNKKEIYDKATINPDYVVPNKWEDLFNLEISDKAIDKLYIASRVQKLPKFYAVKRGESYEDWEKKINEENYEIYEKDINMYFTCYKIEILEKLKFMNLSEQELEDNIWFYKENCEKLIKINEIIKNINSSNTNNLSSQEVLEKIVPENELKDSNKNLDDYDEEKKEINDASINPDYIVPNKWEDLYYIKISDKALKKLYIAAQIQKLIINYAQRRGGSYEDWEKK